MDSPRRELKVSLPPDWRFVETVRELAVHAAKHAGCSDARAHAVGEEVQELVRDDLAAGHTDGTIPFVVRWTTRPIEVLINGRRVRLDP